MKQKNNIPCTLILKIEVKVKTSTKDSDVAVVNVEGLFYAVTLKLKDEIMGCTSNYPQDQ